MHSLRCEIVRLYQLWKNILKKFAEAKQEFGLVNFLRDDDHEAQIHILDMLRDMFESFVTNLFRMMYEKDKQGLTKIRILRNGVEKDVLGHTWWIDKDVMLSHFHANSEDHSKENSMLTQVIGLLDPLPSTEQLFKKLENLKLSWGWGSPKPPSETTGDVAITTRPLNQREEGRYTGVKLNASGNEQSMPCFRRSKK